MYNLMHNNSLKLLNEEYNTTTNYLDINSLFISTIKYIDHNLFLVQWKMLEQ